MAKKEVGVRRDGAPTVEQTARMVPIHIAVGLENLEEVGASQTAAEYQKIPYKRGWHW